MTHFGDQGESLRRRAPQLGLRRLKVHDAAQGGVLHGGHQEVGDHQRRRRPEGLALRGAGAAQRQEERPGGEAHRVGEEGGAGGGARHQVVGGVAQGGEGALKAGVHLGEL